MLLTYSYTNKEASDGEDLPVLCYSPIPTPIRKRQTAKTCQVYSVLLTYSYTNKEATDGEDLPGWSEGCQDVEDAVLQHKQVGCLPSTEVVPHLSGQERPD